MGIGIGIVLLLAGLVLLLDVVTYDIPRVADNELGLLLVVVGALAILLTVVLHALHSRRLRVEERHYEGGPPQHRT